MIASQLQPFHIDLPCPRHYESSTGFFQLSGILDHCAGCGGTRAEHLCEANAVIREQQIDSELRRET